MARKRGFRSGGPPFIQLYRFIKRSEAFHGLSLPARCALIELLDRYTGCNNGMIGLGVRELSEELRCSKDTASKALRELDDAKLVRPTKIGVWRGQLATEWRLAFYRCDMTGDLPNKSWPHRPQSDEKDAAVRPEGRNLPPSTPTRTQKPKNPINKNAPSPTTRTHIESTRRGEPPSDTHWCRVRKRLVTDAGIEVPIVNHPLVGNADERATLTTSEPSIIPDLPAFLDRRHG